MQMKIKRILLALCSLLVLLAVGGFFLLRANFYPATAPAMALLEEAETGIVIRSNLIEFWPSGQEVETGLIIYPGGNVDFRAYAPVARAISDEGYYAAIVRMPLNLAVLDPNRGAGIMANYPDIDRWVVAGHSLGGAMAARFALENRENLQGLIFWASYPDRDLSATGLKVMSQYATRDGVLNTQRFERSKNYLPPDTLFIPIPGGNHAYFGSYGPQRGDLDAEISPGEQKRQIVEAALMFLHSLETETP